MTEPENNNPRPTTPEWSAPSKPTEVPTVPPWPPAGSAAPAAKSKGLSRTWWIVLGVGLGCLTPLLLGVLFFAGVMFWKSSAHIRNVRNTQEFTFRHMQPPGLSRETPDSPYAAHVRTWQHGNRGAPADGDLGKFRKQLDEWVFAENGERVQRDLGEVTSFAASTEFASEGTSGVSVVTLGGAGSRKVRLYVSFSQEVGGAWEFKLNMYR